MIHYYNLVIVIVILQSHCSMQFAFCCVVYPCLVLQYMGQAAFLSKNFSALPTSFYDSIPGNHLVNLHFTSHSSTPYNLYELLQFVDNSNTSP